MRFRANTAWSGALVIVAPLLLCMAALRPQPAALPDKSEPLTCTIRSEPACEIGTTPAISVEISNCTGRDIYLVGSLDASDIKWRYPHCYFEVIGPDGMPAMRGYARCGNVNPIRDEDFVKVPRGGSFDPYQNIDAYGFFHSSQITPATFQAKGTYRIRFVYSSEQADPKFWRMAAKGKNGAKLSASGSRENVVKLLAKVPKTTVCSNEITITVVPPKP